MQFDWPYFRLVNGHIIDDEGFSIGPLQIRFKSVQDAEQYLEDQDIRGSVRDEE